MTSAIVLDSQGLSKAVLKDAPVYEWISAANRRRLPVVISAATLVEATDPKSVSAAYDWTVSRLRVEPLSKDLARNATALLRAAGFHGHRHAIDAMVCATALAIPGEVVILTSDPDDLSALTVDHPRIAIERI